MVTPSEFLVLEDDVHLGRALRRVLAPIRPTRVVNSVAAARIELETNINWCAFFFDIGLGDGSGLDALEFARGIHPLVPALVLTAHTEPVFINRALALRAQYACKDVAEESVRLFAYRAIARDVTADERLAETIEDFVRNHQLSGRETEILLSAVTGLSREEMLTRMDVSPNTFKSWVRPLLRKTSSDDLGHLARLVFQTAYIRSEGNR